ncbi:MAG: hypothetical protein ACREGK_00690, partial [Geminicoccales bacterium]
VILVMRADFRLEDCPRESQTLFLPRGRHIGGRMIRNDQELAVARGRVAKLERVLEDLRKTARPEEWPALSSGYRLEIERTQGEILDHLVTAAPDGKRTTAA